MRFMLFMLVALTAPLAAMAQTIAPAVASSAMTVQAWIGVLSLGALAGAVGQLVRAVAGFAKVSAEGQEFRASKLVVSLMIGATAGALAAVPLLSGVSEPAIPTILGLMGAGYAGADFIEAFAGKYLTGVGTAGAGTIDADKMREEVRLLALETARATVAAQLKDQSAAGQPQQPVQAVG